MTSAWRREYQRPTSSTCRAVGPPTCGHVSAEPPYCAGIYQVLESGGVVAGCSAGAMIWGEKFPGFPKRAWPWHDGFNELNGAAILPHYDEIPAWLAWFTRASRLNSLATIGIERDTALVCRQGRYEVRGSGRVVVRSREGAKSYAEGQTVTWR